MKTKPNFTYKEFIQKISHANISNKDNPQNRSPKALKTHNKNPPTYSAINTDMFQKPTVCRNSSLSNSLTPKHSPRKVQFKQNIIESQSKNTSKQITSIKSTTNKKLKLKNQPNLVAQQTKPTTSKHSKSIRQNSFGNFYHNQSISADQRHNESCSTFFRNGNLDNDEQNFHNLSISSRKKSPSQSSKLTSKKHSASLLDSKIKIGGKGNFTDRYVQRVNTQYYEEVRRPDERINTQYERNCQKKKQRLSPSFYKLSADESSFLEFEEDKTLKNLFPESCSSRCKKSTISLCFEQKTKINEKSYEHIYNKFISKISQTLIQITRIDDQNKLLEHKIKYIEFLECLKELKMIKSDYEPYSQTEGPDLVKELWEELVMGHKINHFIIIVALILKITPLQYIKPQKSQQIQNYIYIQKKYEQFRFRRWELDKSKLYSQKQSMDYYNFPFKPSISKISQQLVSDQRKQKKYKIKVSGNHNQIVNKNSRRQNTSMNNELQNLNQLSTTRFASPLGNKRSQILYRNGKKKSLQKRQNKSTVDYQYEKQKQELTFKPKVIIKKKKQSKLEDSSTTQYVSPRFALEQQKVINRLIRGRVQKQIKQMTIDKGLPYNDKIVDKLRKQKYDEIIKQQQSRIKYSQNQSKINFNQSELKLKSSQLHKRSRDDYSLLSRDDITVNNRCTSQVQHFESIQNLSFQECSNAQNLQVDHQQSITNRIQTSPVKSSNFSHKKLQIPSDQHQEQTLNNSDQFFSLDIYFEQNRSDKLVIRRDSTFEQIIEEAEKFITKHNLPQEMGNKLKQQLMIAMKFHDVEKIEENAEEDECSLLG